MIAYHGTNKENAAAIKQEGFRQGTYFSYRVEDALGFGGNHVFAVEFSADPAKWKGEGHSRKSGLSWRRPVPVRGRDEEDRT